MGQFKTKIHLAVRRIGTLHCIDVENYLRLLFVLYFLAKFPNPLHFITLNLDPIALVCCKKSSSMFGNFCVGGRFCVQHMYED